MASMEEEDAGGPNIGFPLGLALLFVVLLSMSGFFTCCLHWDKVRAFLGASDDLDGEVDRFPVKSSPSSLKEERNDRESIPVLMPGDELPKFIAISCPSAPPAVQPDHISIKVEKPSPFPVY